MGRRLGILTVSYGAIESALHFPEGYRIVGLRLLDTFNDTFEVAVESEHFDEVGEAQQYPRVKYQVTVDEGTDLVPTKTYVGKFI